jgi:selenide,water dikinase
MGAKPVVAMNLLCFPSCLDVSVAQQILAGGADKTIEAGCIIAGGHSITDEEPKYGLCVTGLIHPERILANIGARAGDKLLLTKKVGTGLAVTARKGNLLPETETAEAFESMRALNRKAAEIAAGYTVHACTDITGFGVAGHVCEVAEGSGVTAILRAASLPLLPHTMELALEGIFPGGMYRNKEHYADKVTLDSNVPPALADLFFDPQTSGGLLFSVPAAEADRLLSALRKEIPAAAIIGEVTENTGTPVRIIP